MSCDGIEQLLSNLKSQKASGPDEIPPRFLKEMVSHLAPMLTQIFQASLDRGSVPEDWKKAQDKCS